MRTRDVIKMELVRTEAMGLLVKEGLEGFSMNKLSRRCNISVATLYIYYKDKEDLLLQLSLAEFRNLNDAMLKDFDPSVSFEAGLRKQWENRSAYMLAHPMEMALLEQLRGTEYEDRALASMQDFKAAMTEFVTSAVRNGELEEMPVEVFWSLAYGPLYTLLRFNGSGRSMGGKPFHLTQEILWATFERVLKALKKTI